MDDDLEDEVFGRTLVIHLKLMSELLSRSWVSLPAVGLLRLHLAEALAMAALVSLLAVTYLGQRLKGSDACRLLVSRVKHSDSRATAANVTAAAVDERRGCREMRGRSVGVYAIRGRRPRMEDRFAVSEGQDMAMPDMYAVFDGHGGEFAAEFVEKRLLASFARRVRENGNCETTEGLKEKEKENKEKKDKEKEKKDKEKEKKDKEKEKKDVEKENKVKDNEKKDKEKVMKDNEKVKTDKEKVKEDKEKEKQKEKEKEKQKEKEKEKVRDSCDYAQMITEEILAVDRELLQITKASKDLAGTTALVALVHRGKLIVANVGDSRGVICDNRSNAIPLSFDHKPQQLKEQRRIKQAGGFVSFNGVWRVAGILATSRALGDYPLKDRKLVIADPDVLTFDLGDLGARFMILASDGLWDAFSNEEAVAFVKDRIHEPDFGAKSLTLQAYHKGSLDNITVMVVTFTSK